MKRFLGFLKNPNDKRFECDKEDGTSNVKLSNDFDIVNLDEALSIIDDIQKKDLNELRNNSKQGNFIYFKTG